MKFYKAFAIYYPGWFRDCNDSAIYCVKQGNDEQAKKYLEEADKFFNIIKENWKAIEFFSIGDNAFKIDSALPEEFRGYE
jgi:hypothetical protein